MTQQELIPADTAPQAEPPTDTASMVISALRAGADSEQLQTVIDAIRFADQRDAERAFNAAFTAAQIEIPTVPKRGVVDYQTNKGRTYYTFATLPDIVATVRPILERHGLSFRHEIDHEGGGVTVACIVAHKGGHSVRAVMTAPPDNSGSKNAIQAQSSALTYLRRYTLSAALGIVTDDGDDDGQGADGSVAAVDTLTEAECIALEEAISSHSTPDKFRATICKAYQVQRISDLPRSMFDECLARIEKACRG